MKRNPGSLEPPCPGKKKQAAIAAICALLPTFIRLNIPAVRKPVQNGKESVWFLAGQSPTISPLLGFSVHYIRSRVK